MLSGTHDVDTGRDKMSTNTLEKCFANSSQQPSADSPNEIGEGILLDFLRTCTKNDLGSTVNEKTPIQYRYIATEIWSPVLPLMAKKQW